MNTPDHDAFSPAALEEAIRSIEMAENQQGPNELELWLAGIMTPEYAEVINTACERLSWDDYTAHEAPILEALQNIDGQPDAATVMTIEGIVIEAYTTYLAKFGIFLNDVEWDVRYIKCLSELGFGVRNIDSFYDAAGGQHLLTEEASNQQLLINLISFYTEIDQVAALELISHIDDQLIDEIARALELIAQEQESQVGFIDDVKAALRTKIRNRLVKFFGTFNPTMVKAYLAPDSEFGLDIGNQLAEAAPLFFDILQNDESKIAMELAGIFCISNVESKDIPEALYRSLDDISMELTALSNAKQWVKRYEEFLISLDE